MLNADAIPSIHQGRGSDKNDQQSRLEINPLLFPAKIFLDWSSLAPHQSRTKLESSSIPVGSKRADDYKTEQDKCDLKQQWIIKSMGRRKPGVPSNFEMLMNVISIPGVDSYRRLNGGQALVIDFCEQLKEDLLD